MSNCCTCAAATIARDALTLVLHSLHKIEENVKLLYVCCCNYNLLLVLEKALMNRFTHPALQLLCCGHGNIKKQA
jgi:hypothetical protein